MNNIKYLSDLKSLKKELYIVGDAWHSIFTTYKGIVRNENLCEIKINKEICNYLNEEFGFIFNNKIGSVKNRLKKFGNTSHELNQYLLFSNDLHYGNIDLIYFIKCSKCDTIIINSVGMSNSNKIKWQSLDYEYCKNLKTCEEVIMEKVLE